MVEKRVTRVIPRVPPHYFPGRQKNIFQVDRSGKMGDRIPASS